MTTNPLMVRIEHFFHYFLRKIAGAGFEPLNPGSFVECSTNGATTFGQQV
jgi:hypothetical protein